MTEVERAEQVAREPRRRFKQNIAIVAALLVALALFLVLWHETQTRAETAETSLVSLGEQVQERCDTEGSLMVGDRDLCEQADDVVEGTPVAGPAGMPGIPGPQGERGFTGAQGIQGREGPPGEIGPRGPLGPRGETGPTGADGAVGAAGATGETGATGPAGPQGEPGPQGMHGEQGAQGIPGPQGTAKPGTYDCPDGEYVAGFTVSVEGDVTLTCKELTPPVLDTP